MRNLFSFLGLFHSSPGNAWAATVLAILLSSLPQYSHATTSQTIQLVATDPDGAGTGTARLGIPVSLATTVTSGPYMVRGWKLTGAGTLASTGDNNANAVYTPPLSMPANASVSIAAYLQSDPSVTTTYKLTLINPAATLSTTTPGQVPAGATTTITLTGTGFVADTSVTTNIGSAKATYQSPTSLVANLTLPGNATGSISIRAKNPSPGGGTSAALSVPVSTLQLTAKTPDGTDTGTARLGVPVNFTTTVSNSPYGVRGWSLQGAGTLQSSGSDNANAVYTPPQTMPAANTVVVTAYMSSYPALTTSYTMTIGNPVPAVSSASPSQLLTAGTQAVTLVGSGFVPGTTVAFDGASLPVAYVDYSHATVQVPVPASSTGSLSLQVQNPLPGGGPGTTFRESVAPTSITLTATSSDGNNTGTADLGGTVTVLAAVSGSEQTAVNWALTGAGSISTGGLYTAPATMPANNAVTIKATLASNSAITAVYALKITNPVPAISGANLLSIPAGATTSLTLSGTGFVPQTVVLLDGVAAPTTYKSPTSLSVKATVAAGATGSLPLIARNPAPGGGDGDTYQQAIASPISAAAAARLLDQTTFGPTTSLIQHVQSEGVNAWLAEQFSAAPTVLPVIPDDFPHYCGDAAMCLESEWWKAVLTGHDQLRQRVALALSEMFVISSDSVTGQGINAYANMLANDAFSNWYTIMNDVTLSPGMGIYLNMVGSYKPMDGEIANENFARENMQLFNLGLYLLNPDGTQQLDAKKNPIPAYTEAQVEAFARAYTGWTYANPDGSTPSQFIGVANYYHPMVAVEEWHDQNPKTLLNGTILPGGQSAEDDLAGALTNIFEHPNTPPFVCKALIQHLVTGNPSREYVSRVASVFIDDGNHVRGNMRAVLTAILTDPAARLGDTSATAQASHLREPMLWLTGVMRGLGYINVDNNDYYQYLSNYSGALGEVPYQSPSVFNFFPARYVIPGTTTNSPEFALENTASVTGRLTLADQLVNNQITGFNVDLSATSPLGKVAGKSTSLVGALNTLFMHSQMDAATQAAIAAEVATISDLAQRVRVATYLVVTSSQYKIMH